MLPYRIRIVVDLFTSGSSESNQKALLVVDYHNFFPPFWTHLFLAVVSSRQSAPFKCFLRTSDKIKNGFSIVRNYILVLHGLV